MLYRLILLIIIFHNLNLFALSVTIFPLHPEPKEPNKFYIKNRELFEPKIVELNDQDVLDFEHHLGLKTNYFIKNKKSFYEQIFFHIFNYQKNFLNPILLKLSIYEYFWDSYKKLFIFLSESNKLTSDPALYRVVCITSDDCIPFLHFNDSSSVFFNLRDVSHNDSPNNLDEEDNPWFPSQKKRYHLNPAAWDSSVIVHEYQHHVTSTFIKSSFFYNDARRHMTHKYLMIDVLHEGYSDYLALSYLSSFLHENIHIIGSYIFDDVPWFQRDLVPIQPFENTEPFRDPHRTGLALSSGLWDLRMRLGNEKIDSIVILSLYKLGQKNKKELSFIDIVESLVDSDQDLFGGGEIGDIRLTLYQSANFNGERSSYFKNPQTREANLGLPSCSSLHKNYIEEGKPPSPHQYIASLFFWIFLGFLFLLGNKKPVI